MKKALISSILLLTLFATVKAQEFRNLDFRQKCDSSKTRICSWDLSWGKKNAVAPIPYKKKTVLQIQGENEKSVGFVEQSVSTMKSTNFQILTISSSIKSEDVFGKGAGLNIGLYNDEGALIGTKDMGGFYSISWIRGTHKWKKYTLSIVVPKETTTLKIGMILYGKGKVWFSDFNADLTPVNYRNPSKLAYQYIEAAVDTIAKNSLVRDSINVVAIRDAALKIAGPAKKYRDCYLAVEFLLESLRPYGDHHSFFMTAEEVKNWEGEGSQVSEIAFPTYKVIDSCGYILVPPFHGGNPKQMTAYADSLQAAIETLYSTSIKGWIVDLRQNTGGNMEPMIAGLGPLFSDEKLGALIDVAGSPDAWYYKNGRYYGDDYEGWTVSKPYQLPAALPIAVLTSPQTGSSGEIVVISFIGNKKTRSFGQPTWGLTTGNGSFELKDGSKIFLASTIMADRNNIQYTTSIPPDVVVEDKATTDQDETIEAALKWLAKGN